MIHQNTSDWLHLLGGRPDTMRTMSTTTAASDMLGRPGLLPGRRTPRHDTYVSTRQFLPMYVAARERAFGFFQIRVV